MISIGFQFGVELYSKKSIQKTQFFDFWICLDFVWICWIFFVWTVFSIFLDYFWIFFSISIAFQLSFFLI